MLAWEVHGDFAVLALSRQYDPVMDVESLLVHD